MVDMDQVAAALKAVGGRAIELGISDHPHPQVTFYPEGEWSALLWRTGYKSVTAKAADPLTAVSLLNTKLSEYDPALNWQTLGVEMAA